MPPGKAVGAKRLAQASIPEAGAGPAGLSVIGITGRSMWPLLYDGCRVLIAPVRSQVALGDILLFRRHGAVIVHRIVQIRGEGTDVLIRTKGDGTTVIDPGWIRPSDAIAKVVGLVRRGAVVDLESRLWRYMGWLLAVSSYAVGVVAGVIRYHLGLRGLDPANGDTDSGD